VILAIPRRFTDHQAAEELGVSVDTIRRERRRGKLGYLRIGRRVFITEAHLLAYLERQSVEPCHENKNDLPRSEASGSVGERTASIGAAPGSTAMPDRLAAHRLAQLTFSKPS
jgi:excisionase family DNA binding protein